MFKGRTNKFINYHLFIYACLTLCIDFFLVNKFIIIICIGSKIGELVKLSVSSCANLDKRCILPRNTNVTMTLEFNLSKLYHLFILSHTHTYYVS